MERVTEQEMLDLIPSGNGLIFTYPYEIDDSRMRVAFKRISFDDGRVSNVAANLYQLAKFGSNYKAFCMQVENYMTCKVIVFPSDQVLVVEQDGCAKVLDTTATTLWIGKLIYQDAPPSGVAVYGNQLWACYNKNNVLVRYNLHNMREELRIGGGEQSPFLAPDDLFIDGDEAFVCNAGSMQILRVNLTTYAVSVYKEFTEPPRTYYRIGNYEFVLMKSGILYMLD